MGNGRNDKIQRLIDIDRRMQTLKETIGREGASLSALVRLEENIDRRMTEREKFREMIDLIRAPPQKPKRKHRKKPILWFFSGSSPPRRSKKRARPERSEFRELKREYEECERALEDLTRRRDELLRSLEEVRSARLEQNALLAEKFEIIESLIPDSEETAPIKEDIQKNEKIALRRYSVVTALRGVLEMLGASRQHYTLALSKMRKLKVLFDHPTLPLRPEGKTPEHLAREVKKELIHGEVYVTRAQEKVRNIKHADVSTVNRGLNLLLSIPLPHLVDTGRVNVILSEVQEALDCLANAEIFLHREMERERTELERIERHVLSLKESVISKKQVGIEYYLP